MSESSAAHQLTGDVEPRRDGGCRAAPAGDVAGDQVEHDLRAVRALTHLRLAADRSAAAVVDDQRDRDRSEEHKYELQSLMRHSYAVFCLNKQKDRSQNKKHQEATSHKNHNQEGTS